ncbi:hypothetical protein PIB30_083356 [Stylosanthes scabra]|uniref:Uncharacterized protein n=1 Tax=Stylosanthes scabra TaxID=79078 RepID=A0ABU6WQJ7_9FABA|nr:hypothetical protein [Stylosanthes scabra]
MLAFNSSSFSGENPHCMSISVTIISVPATAGVPSPPLTAGEEEETGCERASERATRAIVDMVVVVLFTLASVPPYVVAVQLFCYHGKDCPVILELGWANVVAAGIAGANSTRS